MRETVRKDKQVYEFGLFRLDATEHLLARGGEPVPMPPKVFDTLLALVENSGCILEKDEFINRLWPDTLVEEGSLTRNISYLRKALGEGESEQYIETVPKRGYRFVAPVKTVSSNGVDIAPERPAQVEIAQVPLAVTNAPQKSAKLKWFSRAASALVLAVIAATFAYFKISSPSGFEFSSATKLTNTGQARFPTLSPDGKYLAQALDDGRRQSLHVRQIEAGGDVEILPPTEIRFRGLTFSRDNGYVYYVADEGGGVAALYRVPALGGVAKRILGDVDSPVALSPDGRRLAFIRNYPGSGESALIVANADGGDQRRVATRIKPQAFSLTGPAWSPDGGRIACVLRSVCNGVAVMDAVAINVRDGAPTPITRQSPGRRWLSIGQLCWTRDDSLLAVAWREPARAFADQVWRISARGGEARQVTNDSNSYTGVSASADGRRVVTTQFTRASGISVLPGAQIAASLLGNANVNPGLSWLSDGRIVYSSAANGHSDLWVMNADGGARKPLTDDIYADLQPVASPNGREIVFVSWRDGAQGLWQMGLDGGAPRLLAGGADGSSHGFSPDGKWIVYDALEAGKPALWRMPSGGGAAERLTSFFSWKPVVSPDGQWLACYFLESPSSGVNVALVRFGEPPAAKPVRALGELSSRDRALLQWTPDSRALVFSLTHEGVSNLWRQPIDGGAARQITNFTEDKILDFAFSRDGRIVYERGRLLGDTVLLSFH